MPQFPATHVPVTILQAELSNQHQSSPLLPPLPGLNDHQPSPVLVLHMTPSPERWSLLGQVAVVRAVNISPFLQGEGH